MQISILKDEKRNLLEQIISQSQEITSKTLQLQDIQATVAAVPRRDIGVMCGVISRTIGVGPQYTRTRTISTETPTFEVERIRIPSPVTVLSMNRGSQTFQPHFVHSDTQTLDLVKHTTHCSVTAKPDISDFSLQVCTPTRTLGVSNDSVSDSFCNKCNVLTRSIGVGPNATTDGFLPVSLKNLSVPRSKSFNLGEEKLGHNAKHRTIGCQSESFAVNRACQYEAKVFSRASQYESTKKFASKAIQHETASNNSQSTDTKDLSRPGKDVHTNTILKFYSDATCNTVIPRLYDASSNTMKKITSDASCNTVEVMQSSEDGGKKEENTAPVSRIPRLAQSPASERHKLKRQDTYTKIPAAIPSSG